MENIEPNFDDNSLNEYPDDDQDYIDSKTLGNFSFLEANQKVIPFKYRVSTFQTSPSNFNFLENRNQYSLIIPIIIENDSLSNSKKLRKSMNSLYLSLPELLQIGITNKNILICLFFLHFSSNKTFSQLYPNTDYLAACCTGDLDYNCSSCYIVSSTGIPIPIISFNKNNATSVECLKVFYLIILDDIKNFNMINQNFNYNDSNSDNEKKVDEIFYVLNWENGVIPQKNTISNLIKASSTQPMSLIPAVDIIPNNIFGELLKFYSLYLQIYFYYYYDMTTSCPLNHKFYLIKMDKKFFDVIKNYFSNFIYNDADMLYNDYKFGVFLDENGYYTNFINEISVSYYERKLYFNDFMMEYCKINSVTTLIIFDLLRSFSTWNNVTYVKVIKKFFLIFQIIDIILDFFIVGLTILITFCIFHECFSQEDDRLVSFFTVIYIICTVCCCSFSLITPKHSGRDRTFLVFHIAFYCFFIFFFTCTIISICQIKRNKNNDDYKFKSIPFIVLVSLNIVFYLTPLFFHIKVVIKSFLSGIKFFCISLPGILSVFKFHSLINCLDLYGQSIFTKSDSKRKINERKKMLILLFFISNAAFGFIAYFLTNRTRRVTFIFISGILFTIFNGLKVIAIICGYIKLYLRKRDLIKFMEEEKNNQKSNSNSLSSIEDEKLDKNEDNKNDKNMKIQDMDLNQLKNYFGDLETKTEVSNLESRRRSLITNRNNNNNNNNNLQNNNFNNDNYKSYSNNENSNSNNSNSNNSKSNSNNSNSKSNNSNSNSNNSNSNSNSYKTK